MRRSLYIHIPFCTAKCAYCNFYSRPPENTGAFLRALLLELEQKRPLLGDEALPSIFIGGGTPSRLPRTELAELLKHLDPFVGPDTEFTCECNPEDVDNDLLALLAAGGVNRVSMGLQSLIDSELRLSGRRHDAGTVWRAMTLTRARSFRLAVDMIIGLPGQTLTSFLASLGGVLELKPEHLSLYCLELDEPVPMRQLFAERPELDPGDDLRADAYMLAHSHLAKMGFEAYEVSNWCRPGGVCRHNLAIWDSGEYVGLGPSAHTFADGRRWSQPADLTAWQDNLLAGGPSLRIEDPRDEQALTLERLLLALRTRRGLDLEDPLLAGKESLLKDCEDAGWAIREEGRFSLLPAGWLRLDGILARLTT
ncbi:MAG: coproporphyrinogen III oxidase family protein [bacterium]|nr:coproporphyrinogen III oxidase family protein [bacterium]